MLKLTSGQRKRIFIIEKLNTYSIIIIIITVSLKI
jgi:hypothetical protein